jgi:arylsulfatase A-like enzyme
MKSLLSLAVFLVCHSLAASQQPNVLVMLTDDQGTLDANCYGSSDLFTPNIDRLAATGIRFTQAYAHMVCCPARAALLTGRHPQRSGISNWTQGDRYGSDLPKINMASEEFTLAEAMKTAGYRTALFGKWHLGAKVGHGPLDQGFDTYFGHLGGFIDNYRHYFLHSKGFHDLWDGNDELFRRDVYYPDLLVDRALHFIKAHSAVPFFMLVAFNLPHYPEQPMVKYEDKYADMPMPRRSYARVISSVDEYVGQILDQLEASGIRENTIVIFMSDNGHSVENNAGISVDDHSSGYPRGYYYLAHGGGGNTGKWIGHKGTFLEGGIRVPAILSYPARISPGQTRDQVVTIMDWFPSILDWCSVELKGKSPRLDGHSVVPIVEDASTPSPHQVLHFAWTNNWAVRKGNWKLIGKQDAEGHPVAYSLHNLAEPKPEVKDHAMEQPDIVTELLELRRAWASDVEAN